MTILDAGTVESGEDVANDVFIMFDSKVKMCYGTVTMLEGILMMLDGVVKIFAYVVMAVERVPVVEHTIGTCSDSVTFPQSFPQI